MQKNEMKQRVIELMHENIPELEGIQIESDTILISSGYMDSFNVIQMIAWLESEFGVSIDLNDINYEDFDTVDSIVEKVILKEDAA